MAMNGIHARMRRTLPALLLAAAAVVPAGAGDGTETPVVGIIRQDGAAFTEVADAVRTELGGEFSVWERSVDDIGTADSLAARLERTGTDLVVLMDNRVISLFREYRRIRPEGVPAVACMGVSVHQAVAGMPDVTGVSYEVPVVLAATGLRRLMRTDLRRLGILHRRVMDGFIAQQAPFCEQEKIAVVPRTVSGAGKALWKSVKTELKRLLADGGVDALWIPNDNVLLNPELIMNVWIPAIRKYRVPVIVGVEKLVDPGLRFGTFAVTPDHRALGAQVAEMVFAAREAGWDVADMPVEFPVSVQSTLNYRMGRRLLGITGDDIGGIDRVLE